MQETIGFQSPNSSLCLILRQAIRLLDLESVTPRQGRRGWTEPHEGNPGICAVAEGLADPALFDQAQGFHSLRSLQTRPSCRLSFSTIKTRLKSLAAERAWRVRFPMELHASLKSSEPVELRRSNLVTRIVKDGPTESGVLTTEYAP